MTRKKKSRSRSAAALALAAELDLPAEEVGPTPWEETQRDREARRRNLALVAASQGRDTLRSASLSGANLDIGHTEARYALHERVFYTKARLTGGTLGDDGKPRMKEAAMDEMSQGLLPSEPRRWLRLKEAATLLETSEKALELGLSQEGMGLNRVGGRDGEKRVSLLVLDAYLQVRAFHPDDIAYLLERARHYPHPE